MKREEVYSLIDEERSYQNKRWGKDTQHSVEEWLLYIEDYLDEAKHLLARDSSKVAYEKAKCELRKIAGMAVCAMEQHDTMSRDEEIRQIPF